MSETTNMPETPNAIETAQMPETGQMSETARVDNVKEKKQDVLAEHILRAAGLSSDNLMSFQHVFRDASTNLCTLLENYTSTHLSSEVVALESINAQELPAIIGPETLTVTFEAETWGGNVIFVLDNNLISLITDAFFGAAEINVRMRKGQNFSPVEKTCGETLAKLLATGMDKAFGTGDGSLLNFKHTQTATQFDSDYFEQQRVYSCRLVLKIANNEAFLHILMPRTCHRPIQDAVTRILRTPSARTDPLWAKKLRQEVTRAHVNIEAYILQGSMTLNEISKLQVGQILHLPPNAVQEIKLRSGNKPLYKCSLGKVGENFSIRVKDPIDEEEEMIDELVHS